MAILNQAEIEALIASRFPDNVIGSITPADIRAQAQDELDSLQSYGGVMSSSGGTNIPAETIPVKAAIFDVDATSANPLLEADHANDLIKVFEPGLYNVTLRIEAQWPATEDLDLLVFTNGAAAGLTPFSFAQAGDGAANPKSMSFTAVAYIVQAADIAAGPGGLYAEVELFFGSDTGDFVVDDVNVATFGLSYSPLSIRTVG